MRTVLMASMRHHTRRYVAASVAVVIGVAFIVVIGMLTGATRSGLTADVGAPVAGVDRVVTTYDGAEVTRLVDAAAERDLPALTLGYAMEPVSRDGGGKSCRSPSRSIRQKSRRWKYGSMPTGCCVRV